MPERPSKSDVIYREGNRVLEFRDGAYQLTSFVTEENYVYSDFLAVVYERSGVTNRLLHAEFKYHPSGINPYSIRNPGETLLARIDRLDEPENYVFEIFCPSQYDHTEARRFFTDPLYHSDIRFSYFKADAGRVSFMSVQLPLVAGESRDSNECRLEGNSHYFALWRRRVEGHWFCVEGMTFKDLITRAGEGPIVVEVPAVPEVYPPERVEITTQPPANDCMAMVVSRLVNPFGVVMELNLPLSLDAIVTPSDFTRPQAVYQKMEEIKQLMLRQRPTVTVSEPA